MIRDIKDDVKKVLYSEEQLAKRVKEMAEEISKDYAGKDLLVVGLLKGSVLFTSDLIKNISNSAQTSGVVRILKDLDSDIENKHVLIVEDIVDTGTTLSYLLEYLKARKAASIEIVALLDKEARRTSNVSAKYKGFDVPDEFIVGYGIDYAERYRNLPYIGILKPEVYEK